MASPEATEAVDILDARPPRTTLRYSTESNRTRNRHVTIDFGAIRPGDIGGLYAAISAAITADLNRVRAGSSSSSSSGKSSANAKAASFFGGGGGGGAGEGAEKQTVVAQMSPLDCELKIELCRVLDRDGRLWLPPVKETSVFRQKHAQLQSSNQLEPRDKKLDLLAWLLDRDVKNAWEHLQDGMFFEEGVEWPWYCLLVSFAHEARLDKVVKYQGRLVMVEVDPQTFFPSPPPSPPSRGSRASHASHRNSRVIEATETVTVSSKPSKRYSRIIAAEPPLLPPAPAKKPTRTPSGRSASAKYAEVRAKSKSAFTIGSLVKAQR